jgi:hypothetical protein
VSGNKTEEIGITNLALSQPSLAEHLDALQKQKEILRTMHGVIADSRGGNIHAQSTSMLPERPTPPAPQPVALHNGWVDPIPLSVPHVRECDRLVDAFEEEERRTKK